jgi:hypothetical protein
MIPVDEYIKHQFGWADVDKYFDEQGEGANPVKTFSDGPYLKLQDGCYWRLPAEGSDE